MADTRTREQLANRATEIVTVLGNGQSPEADDVATVDGFIDGVLAELAARDVTFIPNVNAIPIELFESLAIALAEHPAVARRFGRAADDAARNAAEASLKIITRAQPLRLLRHDPMFSARRC